MAATVTASGPLRDWGASRRSPTSSRSSAAVISVR